MDMVIDAVGHVAIFFHPLTSAVSKRTPALLTPTFPIGASKSVDDS